MPDGRRRKTPTMNALEHQLDYPFNDTLAGSRATRWKSRPACSGCACRCLSRSTTSTCGCCATRSTASRVGRWSTAASRRTRSRRTGRRVFDSVLDGLPVLRVIVTHCHPDHIGLAHWVCAGGDKQRWDVRLWMTLGEYMQARVMAAGDGSNAGGEAAARHFARHGLNDPGVARKTAQSQELLLEPRAGDSGAIPPPARSRRREDRRQDVAGGDGLRPFAGTLRVVLRRDRRADFRRHGAAAHFDQRVGVRHRAGRHAARVVSGVARPLRDDAGRHAGAAVAWQAVSRRAHAHPAIARASRRAAGRSARGMRGETAERRGHRAADVQAPARHPSDDVRAG